MANSLEKEFDDLAKIGRYEETFERYGKKFTFRSLTGEQNLECLAKITEEDDYARVTQLTMLLVCKSLVKVNGIDIEFDDCLKLVSKLQKIVIDELSACYDTMRTEQENLVKSEFGAKVESLKAKQEKAQQDATKAE